MAVPGSQEAALLLLIVRQPEQTVPLLVTKEVTLLIYLPTQMQDVIEQN